MLSKLINKLRKKEEIVEIETLKILAKIHLYDGSILDCYGCYESSKELSRTFQQILEHRETFFVSNLQNQMVVLRTENVKHVIVEQEPQIEDKQLESTEGGNHE